MKGSIAGISLLPSVPITITGRRTLFRIETCCEIEVEISK